MIYSKLDCMSSKVEAAGSKLDSMKLATSVTMLVIGVAGFYYFEGQSLLLRVLGLLAVVAVAIAIAWQTDMGRGVLGFMVDARTEVRKVVWPTRGETVQTSLAVFLVVILVGIFLWFLDMFLLWAVRFVTGQGG